MPNVIAHFFVDDRLESYASFLCDEWMQSVSAKAESGLLLNEILTELLLTWRTIAYTASMANAHAKSIPLVKATWAHRHQIALLSPLPMQFCRDCRASSPSLSKTDGCVPKSQMNS